MLNNFNWENFYRDSIWEQRKQKIYEMFPYPSPMRHDALIQLSIQKNWEEKRELPPGFENIN